MGHGNTELIRKTEPKLSRTENTVDFLTLSEPNRTGKIFWYGSGSYMLSIPRTVPNCTELYRTEEPKLEPKLEPIILYIYIYILVYSIYIFLINS